MPRLIDTSHHEFLRYFDVAMAVTGEQRADAARLRHEVYSEELGFEPQVPSRLESDSYDEHALHCLITHRDSGATAGCVRLIFAGEDARMALEEHCLDSMHVGFLDRLHAHRDVSCEVSRLAVAPAFRRRGSSSARRSEYGISPLSGEERRAFNLVWFAVLLAGVAMAENAGREHLYAMMDAKLPRMLKRAGVHVEQAGDFTQYHGERAAYFITTGDALEHLSADLIELFESIRDICGTTTAVGRAATA